MKWVQGVKHARQQMSYCNKLAKLDGVLYRALTGYRSGFFRKVKKKISLHLAKELTDNLQHLGQLLYVLRCVLLVGEKLTILYGFECKDNV